MTQKVRKAVIPVAGYGTRFLPATKAQPKEMLPVIDKPGVQYAVEEAAAAGITDIILVTGSSKRAIEDHFDVNADLEDRLREGRKRELLRSISGISKLANFIYVRQQRPLGSGHAVLMARAAVGNEPFVMLYPDDLLLSSTNSVKQLLDVYEEYAAPVMAVIRVPKKEIPKYGIIDNRHIKGPVHEVLKIIEKPTIAQAPSNLASIKGFVLPPEIFPFLKRVRPGKGGELFLADAVELYNKHHSVFACELKGELFDLGSKLGWLKANVALGLKHETIGAPLKQFLRTMLR
ncbi:MAG: UTP--glucose-1-phosphate uridylyltransferase GalU [Candidatus Kerfeldbacteria bacterium]|nr:UTP--glucose-1-phosphate uridylyltransferase GalU [Candidatus Kerfeldbacteria bacterium]